MMVSDGIWCIWVYMIVYDSMCMPFGSLWAPICRVKLGTGKLWKLLWSLCISLAFPLHFLCVWRSTNSKSLEQRQRGHPQGVVRDAAQRNMAKPSGGDLSDFRLRQRAVSTGSQSDSVIRFFLFHKERPMVSSGPFKSIWGIVQYFFTSNFCLSSYVEAACSGRDSVCLRRP